MCVCVCARIYSSISEHNMHNASPGGVKLQYSIRCQLTKPADEVQCCIMGKYTVVEREGLCCVHVLPVAHYNSRSQRYKQS